VAGDFDGDGLDEVLVAVAYGNLKQIALRLGKYQNGSFTTKEVGRINYPASRDLAGDLAAFTLGSQYSQNICISGAAGDMDGDGKDEVVLVVGMMVYLLNDDFSVYNSIDLSSLGISSRDQIRVARVATADYDQDGLPEWVLSVGGVDDNLVAYYIIYDDWNHGGGTTVINQNYIQCPGSPGSEIRWADVVTGDFDGDGLPETAFFGYQSKEWGFESDGYINGNRLLILDTDMNANSYPEFAFLNINSEGGQYIADYPVGALAAGDMDMDGKDEIFTSLSIWRLTSKTTMTQPYDTSQLTYGSYPVASSMAVMRDVTGDKKADLVYVNTNYNTPICELKVAYVGSSGTTLQLGTALTMAYTSSNTYRTLCLPNVDNDSYVLEFAGHELLYTDPIIEAVIASPPYWEDANNENEVNGGTTYGKSSSNGGGSSNSGGFAVGISVGYEFDSGIFGNSGVSVKASVENSFNWGSSTSTEVTETWAFSTGAGEDKVVFTAVPFDVYYYTVISAPDEAQEAGLQPGATLTISIPRKPGTFHQELNFYNEHNGDTWDVELPHTIGEPFTYATQSEVETIKNSSKDSKGNVRGLYTTTTIMHVGTSSKGTSKQSVEQVTTAEKSFDYGLELSVEAEAKVAGVTVGRSAKFDYGHGITNSVSSGLFIEGEVPDIPQEQYSSALDFRWGLLMYPMTGKNQSFNLVTYWVDQ
jgi:hypothetical protein